MATPHPIRTDANIFTNSSANADSDGIDVHAIECINGAPVSAADIRRYIKTCGAKRRNDPDYNLGMQILTASERMQHDRIRALALFCRARALSLIASSGTGLPQWAFNAATALFQAAAVEDLIINTDGEVVFEREAFLKRIFQFLPPNVWLQ